MNQLDLLMVHADDRQPVLPKGLSSGTASTSEKPEDRGGPLRLSDDGADQNDLERQRWGVIIPEGDVGKHLLSLIEPLKQARAAAQGGREIKVYTVPAKMTMGQALEWRKKFFDTGKDTTEDLPRYQLILGDLDQVPLVLQQVQASDCYVGRLAFSDDKGYTDYVEKVLRWENKPSSISQARSLLHTVHDQTAATDSGYRALVSPGLTVARKRLESKQFNASEILELGDQTIPNMSDLLDEIKKPDPAMLFTLSHGLGPPRGGWRSSDEQRKLQGAMSFGSEGALSADALSQLGSSPFLPGGVWFMLACYGAGTPESSAYQKWLSELARVGQFRGQPQSVLAGLPKSGERPFIAALPQAVLRNDKGPLAFMGHVDLAWTYSFAELDGGKPDNKPGRFMEILRYVLKGDRVGVAFHALTRYFGAVNAELAVLYGDAEDGSADTPAMAAKRSHLWMLRQDLAGYILLGDPAVRLPLQPAAPPALLKPTINDIIGSNFPFPVHIPGPAPAPKPAPSPAPVSSGGTDGSAAAKALGLPVAGGALPVPMARLEEAFGQLLVGERSSKQIAMDLEISNSELQRLFELYRQGGRRALGS